MGAPSSPHAVLLLVAAFSRHTEALRWGLEQATAAWGPTALLSPPFQFDDTDYYEPTMGPNLLKQFWAFERLIDPVALPQLKLQTNAWEDACARLGSYAESRPLNLDAGYLNLGKLVLASTKDHAHRVYVAQGIYAEVTLSYRDHAWRVWDWTFPDYRRADYQAFLSTARDYFRQRCRAERAQ